MTGEQTPAPLEERRSGRAEPTQGMGRGPEPLPPSSTPAWLWQEGPAESEHAGKTNLFSENEPERNRCLCFSVAITVSSPH